MTVFCGSASAAFTFADITYWVGTGSNQAAFAVQWGSNQTLVWGFRWDGTAKGSDMAMAICAADPRLFGLGGGGTLGGLGYDKDNDGVYGITKGTTTYNQDNIVNGWISGTYSNPGYDGWTSIDSEDVWASGWNNGYWSYWVRASDSANWGYSGLGFSSRTLTNGCWDGWSISGGGYGSGSAPTNMQAAAAPVPEPATMALLAIGGLLLRRKK